MEEKGEREKDDQEIIDMLNDVCMKMYRRISGSGGNE